MKWDSWSDFWAMGGYAVYVWGSVGVTALLTGVEVLQARWARRVVLNQLKTEHAVAQLPTKEFM